MVGGVAQSMWVLKVEWVLDKSRGKDPAFHVRIMFGANMTKLKWNIKVNYKSNDVYIGTGWFELDCGLPDYHKFIVVLYMYVHRHMHAT